MALETIAEPAPLCTLYKLNGWEAELTDAEKLIIEELKKTNSLLEKLVHHADAQKKREDERQKAIRDMVPRMPGMPNS